ncbi:ABC transporter permease [Nitrospinota bacterium]
MTQDVPSRREMTASRAAAWVRRIDYTALVWVLVTLLLILLVVNPIYFLLQESFIPSEENGAGWSFINYIQAFTNPLYYSPIVVTFIISISAGVGSLIVGAIMAWCVSRTDMPAPGLIRNSVLAAFVTPPFLGAIAWIFLAGPRAGWLNVAFRWLIGGGGETSLLNIFSLPGVIFAITLYTFPLVFIVVLAGLNNISSDIEDAANIAGGGTFSTMMRITLPLVLPALFAGFILAVLEAMILFGIPAILAIPAGYNTMTTQLRAFMTSEDNLLGVAAAYSMPMLIAAIWMVWMRAKVLGRRGYATVGGKGGQRRPQKLGPWRYPVFLLCFFPVLCSLFLPYFALVSTSFMNTLGAGLTWSNMTLANYIFMIQNDAVRGAITNTVILALMAATGATALASISAYISQRKLVRGHGFLGFMATLPIGIPGIVLAVGLFAAYTKPPFVLYDTLWILFLAYMTKYLPLAFQTSNAALTSIHPELEECSRILGANRLQVFKDVTVPLFKTGLIASWILVFMPSLRELSSSILLYTTNTKVISAVILDLYDETLFGPISAIGVLLLAITLASIAIGFRLIGRDFLRT